MTVRTGVLRGYVPLAAAVLLLLSIYLLARDPPRPAAELVRLAGSFSFNQMPLPELRGETFKSVREVNPQLRHFGSWISTVGASVALNDLDGDGLPDDVCYIDPRIDKVIVAPVPGSPQRYQPFTLDPRSLPYNPKTMAPMGCLPGDFNEDGLMDILVYYWGRTPIAFLRQKPVGATRESLSAQSYVEREVVATGERWFTNAATVADIDGDGHPDLIIGNYFPDGARILDADADDQAQMQDSMSLAFNGGRKHLLLWKKPPPDAAGPSISFQDAPSGLADQVMSGWTLAVGAADLDGDLLPEIYFANDFGPDRLLHNLSTPGHLRFELLEGERTLTTPKSKVLGRDSFKGMGVDFGDINGDGLLDIYVSNIADEYALEESHFVFLSTGHSELMKRGIAPYVDRSESLGLSRSGWGWDTKLGDFNNDGVLEALQATGFLKGDVDRWPELHELAMGNDRLVHFPQSWPRFRPGDDLSGHGHSCFFVRTGSGRFYDISSELGLDLSHVGRGIATADTDGDGRLDFAIADQWDTSYFFHNESRDPGAFVGLRLRIPVGDAIAKTSVMDDQRQSGRAASRPAIGAQAKITLDGGAILVAQVDGGNGHSGKRSPDLHFGLGHIAPGQMLTVELRWRDAQGQPHQQSLQLSPGRWYTILLGREEGATYE